MSTANNKNNSSNKAGSANSRAAAWGQAPKKGASGNSAAKRSDADRVSNWRAPRAAHAGAPKQQQQQQRKPQQQQQQQKPQQPAAPAEPLVLPTSGPLREFLDENEVAAHDAEFTERLRDLPADVKLNDKWVFWLESTNPPALPEKPQRDDFLKLLKISRTVTNLGKAKEYALQACEHPDNAKIFLFRQGIKPVWEDRSNFNGGRLFVTCTSKSIATNTFVSLVVKMLAGCVMADSELTGFTVSFTGTHRFTVQVWNRNSAEKDKIRDARKAMKKMFKKNVNYQVHRTSLKIYKYGYDQVMPEIEKAQAAKEAKRTELQLSSTAATKAALIEADSLASDLAATAVDAPPSESIIDEASKAVLTAALSSAWETRTVESN